MVLDRNQIQLHLIMHEFKVHVCILSNRRKQHDYVNTEITFKFHNDNIRYAYRNEYLPVMYEGSFILKADTWILNSQEQTNL